MQTDQQAEKLYFEYEKYIGATIYKKFPLHKSFLAVHGLDEDDLFQYGKMGLYRACKSFNPTKGKSMRNHAIQSIIWMINDELPKDSLNNVDNKSLILLDKKSLNLIVSEENGEELSLNDVIGEEDSGYNDIEVDDLIESLEGSINQRLFQIVKMKYKGYTFQEIGIELGVTSQACDQMLKRNELKLKSLLFA